MQLEKEYVDIGYELTKARQLLQDVWYGIFLPGKILRPVEKMREEIIEAKNSIRKVLSVI
ncbi:MAG: hypothetical protein DRJ64_08440 [Thermoprotei archaeon]|nr:MAG: hypothetical protein DRJ64_08440 [Thermoprotei archaeon]